MSSHDDERGAARAGSSTNAAANSDAERAFEPHRRYLRGLAYRMLGSVSDAEDVVQDAFLRWSVVERASVAEPRAYLTRIVTRLCLDQLKSARAQREQYVGTWLPEPLASTDPEELGSDLSVALLLTLERLSPLERAAFLLHDVFDVDYGDVANTLSRSELACRQLAARAREHVRAEQPRFEPASGARDRLLAAFQGAITSGDPTPLAELLAEDVIFYSDGGGRRSAALRPIYGRDKVMRFLAGISAKRGPYAGSIEQTLISGQPGFVLRGEDGVETLALEIAGERVIAVYSVRNPDKVRHLS
jgi:RNA polymerase sigma-70 factor (ECF subfamily)